MAGRVRGKEALAAGTDGKSKRTLEVVRVGTDALTTSKAAQLWTGTLPPDHKFSSYALFTVLWKHDLRQAGASMVYLPCCLWSLLDMTLRAGKPNPQEFFQMKRSKNISRL